MTDRVRSILLIGDDEENRENMAEFSSEPGDHVGVAHEGRAALGLVSAHRG